MEVAVVAGLLAERNMNINCGQDGYFVCVADFVANFVIDLSNAKLIQNGK